MKLSNFECRHLQNLYSSLNALLYMVIKSFDEKYVILWYLSIIATVYLKAAHITKTKLHYRVHNQFSQP